MFGPTIAWAWDNPPARARLLLLDSLGCALAGLRHAPLAGFAAALAGAMPGDIRLRAGMPGLSPAGAAAILAAAMCWDEANDGLPQAHGRPGLACAPVALVALHQGAPLAAALAAYALGYEVAGRAGEMWRILPGLHVDGSWHALGAAATVARLAGGTAAQVGQACAIASCQIPLSLYSPIAAGLDGRNSYPAHAVLLGHMAAAAALGGMAAPDDAFATAQAIILPQAPRAATPPGEWLLERAYLKAYPGVRHAHYGAAAAMALHAALGGAPAGPTRLRLATYAEALRYAGNRAPRSMIAAQFSLSWAVAAALARGRLTPNEFSAPALADPALRGLEALVELVEEPGLGEGRAATLTLDCAQGQFSHHIDTLHGDAATPMDAAATAGKFIGLAGGHGGIADWLLHDGPRQSLFPPG